MLNKFSCRNFRCFKELTVDLTPIHVLVGKNGTGKTSILDGIAAVCNRRPPLNPETVLQCHDVNGSVFTAALTGKTYHPNVWRWHGGSRVNLDIMYSLCNLYLLEQIESGYWFADLPELVAILRDRTKQGQQFILTTYSPYLLDCFKPEEVTHCFRRQDGSCGAVRLDRMPGDWLDELDVFSLGEIYVNQAREEDWVKKLEEQS